jgi:Protein of unknown function (DUF2971)
MPLYKYLCPERLDVLQRGLIRFTQPTACNDPFELRPVVEGFQRPAAISEAIRNHFENTAWEKKVEAMVPPELRHFLPSLLQSDEFRQKKQELMADGIAMLQAASVPIKDFVINGLASRVGILSLSEDPANLLMWAHYASNHSGFVLELDDAHEWFHQRKTDEDEFRHLRKVTYVSRTESRYLMDLEGEDILYAKAADWNYEREWRIIRILGEASVVDGDIHLFEIPPQAVTGIIFGLRSASSLKSSISALIAEQTALRHLRIGEMTHGFEGNKLVVNWH